MTSVTQSPFASTLHPAQGINSLAGGFGRSQPSDAFPSDDVNEPNPPARELIPCAGCRVEAKGDCATGVVEARLKTAIEMEDSGGSKCRRKQRIKTEVKMEDSDAEIRFKKRGDIPWRRASARCRRTGKGQSERFNTMIF
jgi:hypothetical protein